MTWTLCHVPRTAGTSLKSTYPTIAHEYDCHATAPQLRGLGLTASAGHQLFSLIRDPARRALSLYIVETDPYDTPAGFRRWLEDAARGKARDRLPNGLPRWAPQAYYLVDSSMGTGTGAGELAVDRLLRFEDMPWCVAALGLPVIVDERRQVLSRRMRESVYLEEPGVEELVQQVYAGDYELWNQSRSSFSGSSSGCSPGCAARCG